MSDDGTARAEQRRRIDRTGHTITVHAAERIMTPAEAWAVLDLYRNATTLQVRVNFSGGVKSITVTVPGHA